MSTTAEWKYFSRMKSESTKGDSMCVRYEGRKERVTSKNICRSTTWGMKDRGRRREGRVRVNRGQTEKEGGRS